MSWQDNVAPGESSVLTYRNLRAITGGVGLALPVVLLLAGAIDGHVESSLSTYYYTKVGDFFTGALCVMGVFLVAYRLKEWKTIDDAMTTLAGGCALGVAFFHAAPQHPTPGQLVLADWHLGFATTLFVLLGVISIVVFAGDAPKWSRRANWYMALGGVILLGVALMPLLNEFANSFYDNYHLFIILETVCVIAFAVSFILAGLPVKASTHPPTDSGTLRERIDPEPAR